MKSWKLRAAGTLMGAALLVVSSGAHALTTSTADIIGTFDGVAVDIAITYSNAIDAVGGHDIVGLSGTVGSFGNVTLWVNPNQPDPYNIPHSDPNTGPQSGGADLDGLDNVWYSTAPYLLNGVGFVTTGYAYGSNYAGALWGTGPGQYGIWVGNGNLPTGLDVAGYGGAGADAVVTPLPSTWTMLIAGFAGFGFLAYRGTKKSTALAAA